MSYPKTINKVDSSQRVIEIHFVSSLSRSVENEKKQYTTKRFAHFSHEASFVYLMKRKKKNIEKKYFKKTTNALMRYDRTKISNRFDIIFFLVIVKHMQNTCVNYETFHYIESIKL